MSNVGASMSHVKAMLKLPCLMIEAAIPSDIGCPGIMPSPACAASLLSLNNGM